MILLRRLVVLVAAISLAGCQNADLLKPEGQTAAASGERAFTRVGEEDPGPLTSEVAYDWFDRLRAVNGQERLDLIEEFLAAFPAARRLPVVQEMQADALAAEQRLGDASDAYERALVMTRTDITGLPLVTDLPLQLGLTRLSSGNVESGTAWLIRTNIADQGERVLQGLRWIYANHADGAASFEDWRRARQAEIAPDAPAFRLPGLLQTDVDLEPGAEVTLVNFWSPT